MNVNFSIFLSIFFEWLDLHFDMKLMLSEQFNICNIYAMKHIVIYFPVDNLLPSETLWGRVSNDNQTLIKSMRH